MKSRIGKDMINPARLLRVISHPVRLAILEVLCKNKEMCVCHFEALFELRQAYLSQQLMCLREHKLVKDRRDGRNVYYSINEKGVVRLIQEAKKCFPQKNFNSQVKNTNYLDCENKITQK